MWGWHASQNWFCFFLLVFLVWFSVSVCFVFETGSCSVVHAGLELMVIVLSQPSKCQGNSHGLPHTASFQNFLIDWLQAFDSWPPGASKPAYLYLRCPVLWMAWLSWTLKIFGAEKHPFKTSINHLSLWASGKGKMSNTWESCQPVFLTHLKMLEYSHAGHQPCSRSATLSWVCGIQYSHPFNASWLLRVSCMCDTSPIVLLTIVSSQI